MILIGRLTRDPELRFTPVNGIAVCKFTLAVDRDFKNKDGNKDADFINLIAWNKLAEIIANYATKGRLVAVSGRLQTSTYDGKDGQKHYVTEVAADGFQLLDKKKDTSTSGPVASNGVPEGEDFFPADPDEDIPF